MNIEKFYTNLNNISNQVSSWITKYFLTTESIFQIGVIAIAYCIAFYIYKALRPKIVSKTEKVRFTILKSKLKRSIALLQPVFWLILTFIFGSVLGYSSIKTNVIEIFLSLISAWTAIRLFVIIVASQAVARTIAIIIWSIAALDILNLLEPLIIFLGKLSFKLGKLNFSALSLLKGILVFTVLAWIFSVITKLVDKKIKSSKTFSASIQVLTIKLSKIIFIIIAFLIALNVIGIDLTAFAVFGGALGLGIGFGLQKIVSNIVSGIILLLDKSVKPGDVIALGESYGWINSLNARYVSVLTRDGIEHLIPNEDLISQRVENWSFTHRLVRIKISAGVSYNSDVEKAIKIMIDCAKTCERVLEIPQPVCFLTEFGDSSVNLQMRLWINDPESGTTNLKSEILLKIYKEFKNQGIEIPFPQRDIHLVSKKYNN